MAPTRTVDQRIAEKEAELHRLKEQKRKDDTKRKITVGALVMDAAEQDQRIRRVLTDVLRTRPQRKQDRERANEVLELLGESPVSTGAGADRAEASANESNQGRDPASMPDQGSRAATDPAGDHDAVTR